MRLAEIAIRLAMASVAALLVIGAREAAAQVYHPQAFERFEPAPALALQLSPSGMRSLHGEFDDLHSLDAFGGKRRIDPFSQSVSERPEPWTLFGRLGVLNYQNELGRESATTGRLTLKRSGPSIGGSRISIGIRRRF
jgi:hypothetical protein